MKVAGSTLSAVDPILLGMLIPALASAATAVGGSLRRRSLQQGLVAQRERFVAGLPAFARSAHQEELVASLAALSAAQEGLEALVAAGPHLRIEAIDVGPAEPERALLHLAETAMADAAVAVAVACGEAEALDLLREAPGTFAELAREGAAVLAQRPRLAAAKARVEGGRAELAELRRSLDEGRAPESLLEARARTVTHATLGGLAGAKVGAVVGTALVPGLGTALGAAVGGLAASFGAAHLGRELSRWEREGSAKARADAIRAFHEEIPASARRALAQVASAVEAPRRALDAARASVAEVVEVDADTRQLVADLLRTLSWRLDEGLELLQSEGELVRAPPSVWLERRAREAEQKRAQDALASKRRSHARATEALKSALREHDPLRALVWVAAVPLPSYPDVDELFDRAARALAQLVRLRSEALEARRAALAHTWVIAMRAFARHLERALREHQALRERVELELLKAAAGLG